MKVGVVVFPASNCDKDTYWVFNDILGVETVYLWHKDRDLQDCDLVVLPGGFSYGDYLRAGAIAKFSPIMERIVAFAQAGGLTLGICNGFQILQEVGLLEGVMLKNKSLKFISKYIYIKVGRTDTPFTNACEAGEVLRIPIAHFEGNFYCKSNILDRLETDRLPLFRYCDRAGNVLESTNPNGALNNIAGICNEGLNVLGMMPHPERACEDILRSSDGFKIINSIRNYLDNR